jgi:Cu/Ag efflux protein CusF
MLSRRFQTLLLGALPLALAACSNATSASAYPAATSTPLGIDLGSSAGHMAAQPAVATSASPVGAGHKILPPGGARTELVHEDHGGASASGTVNSVDVAAHRLNISHGPIQALGWPPMTMDFPVSPSVNLNAIKPGGEGEFHPR